MSRMHSWREFLRPKLRRVAEFLSKQGITVAGNLLYGLLCIRLLPVPDYAKFVVLFGVQGTLIVLMDIGISGTLIPLVAHRIDDRQLIADYVASLRKLAHWLYALMVPISFIGITLVYRRLKHETIIEPFMLTRERDAKKAAESEALRDEAAQQIVKA